MVLVGSDGQLLSKSWLLRNLLSNSSSLAITDVSSNAELASNIRIATLYDTGSRVTADVNGNASITDPSFWLGMGTARAVTANRMGATRA